MGSFARIKLFLEHEQVTVVNIFKPHFILPLLIRYKYIHFFLTGVTGVGINLILTWVFTEFVFGQSRYFEAYLIGVAANLIYNFVLHTVMTFKTRESHLRRFSIFIGYSLLMTAFQAWLVKLLVPVFGAEYYLVVIGSIILIFSTVSFLLFKLALFNEEKLNEKHS